MSGKRAGHRTTGGGLDRTLLLYAAGVTLCVVAWGYLVFAAIDFGGMARNGESLAWLLLVVACLGAACCLFAGLLLGTRALIRLGIIAPPRPPSSPDEPPRPQGGKRAAR